MATSVGPITASVPFASPDESGGMSVPSRNGLPKPVFKNFHIIDMIPLQCSPLDDALDRLCHVEPGACMGGGEEENAMLGTPLGQAWTLVPCQVIPDQQHPDWRQKPVQLLGCGIDVPILPAASFGNHRRRGWTLLYDR